jgi:hypothetical protein
LVTFVDIEAADPRQRSFSARHEAELADGRRLLLLSDRGWTERQIGLGDIWSNTPPEEIERTARFVVGPDEPFDGRTQEDMEADHWTYLASVLRRHGVRVDALELRQLRHDVVLSRRLLARIGRR